MWVCDPSVAGHYSQSDTSTLSIIVHIPFPLPYYSRHETTLVSEIFQIFFFWLGIFIGSSHVYSSIPKWQRGKMLRALKPRLKFRDSSVLPHLK